jgi:hypothetical protein
MIANFSEHFVQQASRYVLRKEYRRTILKCAMWLLIALVAIAGLAVAGVVSTAGLSGLLAGLLIAAALMALTFWFAYRQNVRFPLLVYRNEAVGEVGYHVSDSGCSVSYKGVEVTLPWRLLRGRSSYGEYEVLEFSPSESYSSSAKAIAHAFSHSLSGPELLGFPIFCAVPGPRLRYLFIPKALINDSPNASHMSGAPTPVRS